MAEVITRFPPSPTGNLHVGSARTALFNFLYARKMGGKILYRLEDTDRERSKPEFERNMSEGLAWLGLTFDNKEPWRQSERGGVYQKYLEQLLASGKAFDDGEVIRFKNPNTRVSFHDLIRGEVSFDTTELGDFVIAKSRTAPLYHLAVVIDDAEMGVTHVIRGEDHISNTPRQILLGEALGFARPAYAHIPLILGSDRSKLSKRKHGKEVWITEYQAEGYLPEAMINFLATLGWSPQSAGISDELLTLEQLIQAFDLSKVQSGGAIFNVEKLKWFNREYIKRLPPAELLAKLGSDKSPEVLAKLVPELLNRAATLGEMRALLSGGEMEYFFTRPAPSKELLGDTTHLATVMQKLRAIPDADWTAESIKAALWDFATQVGRGAVLGPLRLALAGRPQSADPFTIAAVVGKEETLARLQYAVGL